MASEIRTLVDNSTDIYPKTVASAVIMSSGDTVEDSAANSVKYVEQSLTDAQKTQALNNIEAQQLLVSGTNIKTINNTSLLGSGNIDVDNVFWATYEPGGTSTSAADIESALNAGKEVLCFYNNILYEFERMNNSYIFLSALTDSGSTFRSLRITRGAASWTSLTTYEEVTSNKVSTISGNEADTTKYPNTKAVYDALSALPVIPSGGTTSQVLAKASGTDYDVEWANASGGPSDVFWAMFGRTSFNDISAAITAGKLVMLNFHDGTQIGVISDHDASDDVYMFTCIVDANTLYTFTVNIEDLWAISIKPLVPQIYRGSYNSTLENWSISTTIRDEIISRLKDGCIVYLKDVAGAQTTIEMVTFYCEDTDELLTSTGHVINII